MFTEAPVRLWHWVNAWCIIVLAIDRLLDCLTAGRASTGEANDHFMMGYIRFSHFTAGQTLAVGFLLRIYWAFVGNAHARPDLLRAVLARPYLERRPARNSLIAFSKIAEAIYRA